MASKIKPFHFKQFTIQQERSSMKVGTDGVLLGAWVDVLQIKNVLDIGAGTGLIALMVAQRTPAHVQIDALEIQESAYQDTLQNVNNSSWKNRVKVFHTSIQEFESPTQYDLIVSNPPYFQNSLKPPTKQREVSRHNDTLTFEDLLKASKKLLTPTGRLSVILPLSEGNQFIERSKKESLFCIRRCRFKSKAEKPVERLLLEFSNEKGPCFEEKLNLYNQEGLWSDQYKALTKDFYLKI